MHLGALGGPERTDTHEGVEGHLRLDRRKSVPPLVTQKGSTLLEGGSA